MKESENKRPKETSRGEPEMRAKRMRTTRKGHGAEMQSENRQNTSEHINIHMNPLPETLHEDQRKRKRHDPDETQSEDNKDNEKVEKNLKTKQSDIRKMLIATQEKIQKK